VAPNTHSVHQPKVTVLIPTRERAEVLVHALRTVTAQDYENLEIIVSDNASQDATREVVHAVRDPRVRYINTDTRVSMTDNWEFALDHVRGDWCTIIGDDDGLMPNAIANLVAIARETGARAIRSRVCKYSWPSRTGLPYGRLTTPLGHGYEIRDSETWLERVMRGLCTYAELPILYTGGFVERSVIDGLKRDGRVYRSCIPDVYSAISISSVVATFVFVHEPLAVSGASAHSTGASMFSNTSTETDTPATMFHTEQPIPMHPDIPKDPQGNYPKAVQALVYECYLQTQFFRGDRATERHAEQLEIILAVVADRTADDVVAWAQVFAKAHGLDFDAIRSRAAWTHRRLAVAGLPARLSNALARYEAGSPRLPLRNVAEATISAAAIREAMPGRLVRLREMVGRAVRRRRLRAGALS
jgi:hypothetical protein